MTEQEFSSGTSAEVRGLTIKGEGLRGAVEHRELRQSDASSPFLAALERTEGLEIGATAELSRLEFDASSPATTTRGGASVASRSLKIDLPPSTDGDRHLIVVEEAGNYAWIIPESDPAKGQRKDVEIPLEVMNTDRGVLSVVGRRVLRLVTVKAGRIVEKATGTVVGAWDQKRHPVRLGQWTPGETPPADGDGDTRTIRTWGDKPGLLVVHGFLGSSSGTFAELPRHVVKTLHSRYDGRVVAYDHPTITLDPKQNARRLVDDLPDGVALTVDILAHSRGGLVARELARLRSPKLTVRSITFVGSPNDGTPLADMSRPKGLLDAVTNLAGVTGIGEGFELALGLATDLAFDHAFKALEGLNAMHPDAASLTDLNAALLPGVEFRAIATDFKPVLNSGFVRTNLDRLIDLYFGGIRNDRVVPTMSTYTSRGSFAVPLESRLVLDSSRSVDHVSFWRHEVVTTRLLDWLRPDWPQNPPERVPESEADPIAELRVAPDPTTFDDLSKRIGAIGPGVAEKISEVVGGPLDRRAASPTGERPAVFVLPGIMGSYLRHTDGPTVWCDPRQLLRGKFSDLELGITEPARISTAGVHRSYLPLLTSLASYHDVYVLAYDWRLDIRESAGNVARQIRTILDGRSENRQRFHLVAHSMGGLVSRAIALSDEELWKAFVKEKGRLIQLGTPNHGSYATILTLLGLEAQLKLLAVADLQNSPEAILRIVASFPGVYQLLPSPTAGPDDDDHAEIYTQSAWNSPLVSAKHLSGAAEFHKQLAARPIPEDLVYIAGGGHATPARLEIKDKEFLLGVNQDGDGRVPHKLGLLDGATTLYTPASHGGMIHDPDVLTALTRLLVGEEETGLSTTPPATRDGESRTELKDPGSIDPEPPAIGTERGDRGRISISAFGQALDQALSPHLGLKETTIPRPEITVRVVHGSLEKSKFPVAVGHYSGLPLEGAEGFLDWRLEGALRNRQATGNYPDAAGTAITIAPAEGHRPNGALVLGLGRFGDLTPRVLSEAMAHATSAAALHHLEQTSGLPADEVDAFGVAAVLIGTPGRHGVTVRESISAMTEGVATALVKLMQLKVPVMKCEFEIVELYELKADEALREARELNRVLPPHVSSQIALDIEPLIVEREGGRTGAPEFAASGSPWIRFRAELDSAQAPDGTKPPTARLDFSVVQRGAQVNVTEHQIDFEKVKRYVEAAIHTPDGTASIGRTLFELLFPHSTKFELDRSENMQLEVSSELADIPWELVADRGRAGDVRPLAIRAGMLRQLPVSSSAARSSLRMVGRNALVIGDPPSHLPELPGARAEAQKVANRLEQAGYEVERQISNLEKPERDNWSRIQDALLAQPYRIVHVAAHGVFQDEGGRTGIVTGPEPHHRLTAVDFRAMSTLPELVFINACHLGRLGSLFAQASEEERAQLEQTHARPHLLARSLAWELIESGVRAVVVAGWAVEDTAAQAFAVTLYEELLGGEGFGQAVKRARAEAFKVGHGRTNTWGAFQCYGDPGFQLPSDHENARSKRLPTSPRQLARDIDNLATNASDATTEAHLTRVRRNLEEQLEAGVDVCDSPEVHVALFRAYCELGDFASACASGERLRAEYQPVATIDFLERYENIRGRYATERLRGIGADADANGNDDDSEALRVEMKAVYEDAEKNLENLNEVFGQTAERLALLGSLHKQRATTGLFDIQTELEKSREFYKAAHRLKPKSYYCNNWLQMEALTRAELGRKGLTKAMREALGKLDDEAKAASGGGDLGYWEIAASADLLLTKTACQLDPEGADSWSDQTTKEYLSAFRSRSSVAQRRTVLRHLDDLARLAKDTGEGDLGRILTELRKWSEAGT